MSSVTTWVASVMTVVLCGCAAGGAGAGGSGGQPIVEVIVGADPTVLEIEFAGCDGEPGLDVQETSEAVRITVPGSTDCEAVHDLTVELDAPLDGRRVIDGTTGDDVAVGG